MFNREKLNFLTRWWFSIDKVTLFIVAGLMLFGIVTVASSSPAVASRIGASKLFFIHKHFVFVSFSAFLILLISLINKEKLKEVSIIGMGLVILLLIAVQLFGTPIKGSKRWLFIFGVSLQPSEIIKPFFVVFNAFILEKLYDDKRKFLIVSIPYVIILILLFMQPDIGMSILITILFCAQLFLAGLALSWIYLMGFLGAVFITVSYIFIPHVTERINRYIGMLFGDASGKNYQVEKSIEGIKHGGFLGQGPVEGQVKNYIPDAHTDFIFSVIGEEFGFIFCLFLIFIFFFMAIRILVRNLEEENLFTYLSVSGLSLQLILQVSINIGVTMGILPTKGMTLPFISYGGSSLIGMGICVGMIMSFTRNTYDSEVSSRPLFGSIFKE